MLVNLIYLDLDFCHGLYLQDTIALDAPKRHKLSVHIASTAEGSNGDSSPEEENKDVPNGTEPLAPSPQLPQVMKCVILVPFKEWHTFVSILQSHSSI